MSKKTMTYLQFKSTADKLALTQSSISPSDLYNLLSEISNKEEINQYYNRWMSEQEAKTNGDGDKLSKDARSIELEKSLSVTRATLESTADAILIIDKDGKVVDFNQKFLDVTEIPAEIIEYGEENEGLGYLLGLLRDPDELISQMQYLMMHPSEDGDMGDVHFKNGKIVERYSQPHRIGSEIVGRVWSFRDVTKQRIQEEALRLSNRAITASTHGVIIIDNNENFTINSINPAGQQLLTLNEKEVIGSNFLSCFDGFKDYTDEISKILKRNAKGTLVAHYKDQGKSVWLEINIDPVKEKDSKKITHFVALINDVTKNKELEKILKYKAVHDALTGLPNKSYIEDSIKYRIQKLKGKLFAIMFIDIDRFKNINDTLGHRIGDKLLRLFGKRIRSALNKKDILARVGGDEFIIMLNSIDSTDDIDNIVDKLLKIARNRFIEGDHEFNISASIGIAHYPACGQDSETLIRNADIAMYQAKNSGRNQGCFYSTTLDNTMTRRVQIENQLHHAIENNEFKLLFQPIYDIKRKAFNKAEALIRWNNKYLGNVSPLEFISIAEDIGMMTNIGRWVIETGIKQLKAWNAAGYSYMKLGLNVSPKQLMDSSFVGHIETVLKTNDVPANQVILELTETFFLLEGAVLDTLSALSDLGVKVSIDDFGTGYSNLGYLNQLNISYLKVDKSFIDQIEYDDFNDSVLLAIMAIANQMHFQIVAEGVETQKQFDYLVQHQCDQIQGYFFSKPLERNDFENFIQKNNHKRE